MKTLIEDFNTTGVGAFLLKLILLASLGLFASVSVYAEGSQDGSDGQSLTYVSKLLCE